MAISLLCHLTARVSPVDDPFSTRAACADMWLRLREAFPHALAAVLMPSHLHVVTPVESREAGLRILGAVVSGFSRRFHPGESLWSTSTKHETIQTEAELRRQIRYVLLNPCRDRLCPDPLMWEWSTYRDLMGAAAPVWPDLRRMCKLFGYTPAQFQKSLHAYISGDPSVAVAGTAPPRAPQTLIAPLTALSWAVLTAMRSDEIKPGREGHLPRQLVTRLARRLGLVRIKDLSPLLGVSERALFRSLAQPCTPGQELLLNAALSLLSDARYSGQLEPPGRGAGLVTHARG